MTDINSYQSNQGIFASSQESDVRHEDSAPSSVAWDMELWQKFKKSTTRRGFLD